MSNDIPKPTVRFTLPDVDNCGWTFNCGPGALCAIVDLTPAEIHPHMLDFDSKGYTNPTLMTDILKGLGRSHRQIYRSDEPGIGMPKINGLVRLQWGGPWTKPHVPMRARYRHTHWVAVRGDWVFDINAICVGGWLPSREWIFELTPWLIKECCPKGDGTFWPTHVLEVEPTK